MLVSVSIDDIRESKTEIEGVYNGKNISPNIEVVCNKDNVAKTLNTLLPIFKSKKTKVLHVSYEGDLSYLEEVLFSGDYSEVPIVLKRNLSEIGQVDLIMMGLPKNVKLVLYLDTEINNTMKTVHGYSQKYENISFCGDNLIALKGCRLGCTDKVIKDLTAEDGCYMGYKKLSLEDIEELEFVEAASKPNTKVKKEKVVKEPKVKEPKVKEEKVVKEPKPKKEKVVKEPKPKKEKVAKPKKAVSSILARRLNKGE